MSKPLEILQKYWKHDAFRTPQEEIIASVLEGKDTFGLMPTGGGKSITFQVPAMMMEGICLVISPLVALMKDQVKNLQDKGIKAIALTGGISSDEMIDLLDNCQFGNFKFLYLSPERLQNDWILERIKNLPINLIAVDEAHCISQWGHDFRPAYLKISKLKEYFPKVPFLALTASATKRVQDDIIEQLQLKNPSLFTKSFERENLAYMVFNVEDKLRLMEQILKKNPQPSIIYVTNRKACSETVKQLESLGFSATYYHGGLSSKEKDNHMKLWMDEKVQTMVATNAFGMGIDKANVKTVIHLHIPPNLENYYQEAGRAGRNGEKAFAVLLTNPSDVIHVESQFLSVLSDKEFLNLVFKKLCNYFQIAYGEGIDEKFSFNINQFCTKYGFSVLKVYNALQFLDRQGIISLSQEFTEKISLQFIIPSKEVIRYMSLNPQDEEVVLTILRTNPGVYESQSVINISLIAKKSNSEENKVLAILHKLHEKQVIELHAKNNDATITFNEVREDERTINRVAKYLEAQNKLKTEQLKSVLHYIKEDKICKNKLLLSYFGETISKECGVCSYCISKRKLKIDTTIVQEKIIGLLKIQEMDSREIQKLTKYPKDDVIFALQNLLENDSIIVQTNNTYSIKTLK
ncbi:RecQ family ATP-dependent DNA helicase [Flavobacterium aquatile]|uniref:ATP-dependent DNA helicase RecQ n=1 Tax=Flavobacterium aquatile LMG 4008 = ATCC 11947 TaxID=1453498 RepID=A0A095U4R5_9FLAO|nr:ATP-dependent DNA helicase RecQ [Flavobacterium aquatile]KGD69613.1 ATP-dependent DNA helicase RecQ [Flavobacterium aquatile LMG 4008 = ATCC 11947]OXA67248.1 recombinase RecQ [Flavobacterium aquatile] [Flavobacterium aquatile LMG 4008 = ATCC 11947]GEC77905.1 ATP-dependent DNA helicase RecQ2 [Flavobacterium aquatile]